MKEPESYRSCRKLADALRVLPRCSAVMTATAGFALWMSPAAEAYVGPGAGMGVLGVMIAVVAAIFVALVGMVLWPIRLVAHRRKVKAQAAVEARQVNAGNTPMPAQDAPGEPSSR